MHKTQTDLVELTAYCATHKTGRCANGAERGRGLVLHAVERGTFEGVGNALCGAEPGNRSAGWSGVMRPLDQVNCPRCLKRIEMIRARPITLVGGVQ